MWLPFLYRLVPRILEALRVHGMDSTAKDAEILVLCQLPAVRRRVTPKTILMAPGARTKALELSAPPPRPAASPTTGRAKLGRVRLLPDQGHHGHRLLPCRHRLPRRYYVCFVIEAERHVVHFLGVTENPTSPWVTQVARNFAAELEEAGRSFRFLIRDRDTKFAASIDAVFASMGTEAINTPVRSWRANAVSERFLRSIRTECLDHLLVLSRLHLGAAITVHIRRSASAAYTPGLDVVMAGGKFLDPSGSRRQYQRH